VTNTSRKLAALALAAPAIATLGLSGTAAANAYEADADCVGLVVDMPRAEDGTTVTAYRNGIIERSVYVATFGDPVRFTIPSPDQTVRQSWRVVVTGHNGTSSWSEVVAPCVAPSTSSTAPATTTTVPPTTTTVAVSTPPVPSTTAPATTTTTVQPPRATTTTVAARPTFTLPATGPSALDVLALIALCAAAVGAFLAQTARRRPR
jgi:hypothetical protein